MFSPARLTEVSTVASHELGVTVSRLHARHCRVISLDNVSNLRQQSTAGTLDPATTGERMSNQFDDLAASDEAQCIAPLAVQFAKSALLLAGGVGRNQRILDAGIGTNILAAAAAETGAQVFNAGSPRNAAAQHPECIQSVTWNDAQVADSQASDPRATLFDATFSIFGVMLLPDWRRGMTDLVRQTRPLGRVVVASWATSDGAGPMQLLSRAYRRIFPEMAVPPRPSGILALSSPESLRAEMVRAGCADITLHKVSGAWVGSSVTRVLAEIRPFLCSAPLYDPLDEDALALMSGVVRAALTAYTEPNGAFHVPVAANVAVGQVNAVESHWRQEGRS